MQFDSLEATTILAKQKKGKFHDFTYVEPDQEKMMRAMAAVRVQPVTEERKKNEEAGYVDRFS